MPGASRDSGRGKKERERRGNMGARRCDGSGGIVVLL